MTYLSDLIININNGQILNETKTNPYLFKTIRELSIRNRKPCYDNSNGNVINIYDNTEQELFLRTSDNGLFSWIQSIVLYIHGTNLYRRDQYIHSLNSTI